MVGEIVVIGGVWSAVCLVLILFLLVVDRVTRDDFDPLGGDEERER